MVQRLSVLVPVYGNEATLVELRDRVLGALRQVPDIEPTVVLVDDASPDGSWAVIESLASASPDVVGLRLASNVGQLRAICAGLDAVGGEILVSMDADLEHPPEVIPDLVRAFREGHDLVTTKRLGRPTGTVRGMGSLVVNRLARLVGLPVADVGSSFLVCTPEVAAAMRRVVEQSGRQMILAEVVEAARNPTTVEVELSTTSASSYAPRRVAALTAEFFVAQLGPKAARRALVASALAVGISFRVGARRRALLIAASLASVALVGTLAPRAFRRTRRTPFYEVAARVGGRASGGRP